MGRRKRHARHDGKAGGCNAAGPNPNFDKQHRRFRPPPGCASSAPRNVPRFAFEYGDTGAGNDIGIAHNWAALDAIKIVPRYGVMPTLPPIEVELFGRRYAAPIGIAPMGGPSIVWPGADLLMAKAAQRARVPYTLGRRRRRHHRGRRRKSRPTCSGCSSIASGTNDHKIGFDLVRRAQAADVKVLALTLDVPVRTTRSRETYAGLGRRVPSNPRMIYEMLIRPKWLLALLRNGYPRFATIRDYAGDGRRHQ